MDTEEERTEARYKHLLEPIRELAQNWAIDIASEVRRPPGVRTDRTLSWLTA